MENTNKQYKSISVSISGVLSEIKKRDNSTSIRLFSDTGASEWCFYKGVQIVDEWLDKNVICYGTMNKRAIESAKTRKILGYERVFTIFNIVEQRPRSKNLSPKVVDDE